MKNALEQEDKGTIKKIKECCENIQHRENANIVSFLVHQSKKPFILDEILKAANRTISDAQPIHLIDGELTKIEQLVTETPKIILQSKEKKDVRKKVAQKRDEHENQLENKKEVEAVLSDISLTLRILEIIGHIVKENSHKLESERKEALCNAAYNLAMRLFGYFVVDIESNSEDLVKGLQKFIKNKSSAPDAEKLEKEARRIVFQIVNMIGATSIVQLSNALAFPDLKRTFEDILKNNEESKFIHIADVSLNLSNYEKDKFPLSKIRQAHKISEKSRVATNILRAIVVQHLHLFNVDYNVKQSLYKLLEIGESAQKKILISNSKKLALHN